MDGYQVRMGKRDRSAAFTFLFGLFGISAVLLINSQRSCDAASIRSHVLRESRVRASSVSTGQTWRDFLRGGVSRWSTTPAPRFPSGIHLATSNGRLVETQFVDYLLYRRSLAPARFDAHHPNIALPLAQLLIPPPVVPPTVATPTPTNPQPQGLEIPEPSSILISCVTFGTGFVWLQRRKRARSPEI